MRGSPFLRTLLLAGGLLLAGLVLWRLMRVEPAQTHRHDPVTPPVETGDRWGFELKLSRRAESVTLKTRDDRTLYAAGPTAGPLLGTIAPATTESAIFIMIRWTAADEGNHFAKLTLEPPGKPTRVRFFETAGDLEDVWELSNE